MKRSRSQLTKDVLEAIQKVSGVSNTENPLPLHEPNFQGTKAWAYVKNCLDTGWVSTAGKWVNEFERQLSEITGATHVIAVSNGTVALRLALHVVGVEAGDEVMLPAMSFVATANAVSHLGAYPHFVDIEPRCLGLCPKALSARLSEIGERRNGKVFNVQTGRKIAAVLPVHVFGHPANIENLKDVADSWGLPLIEDAAEALGSWKGNKHCGLFGKVGTLSFNGNKLITTGGGGALITNDTELAKEARHLSTTAKITHTWEFNHDSVAWNDRLPNINAALGVAQLEDLSRRLEEKKTIYKSYAKAFEDIDQIELIHEPIGCNSNHWLVSIRFTEVLPTKARSQRLEVLESAHEIGLLLRPVWKPLNRLSMYEKSPSGPMYTTIDQESRILNLPSSPQLSKNWKK